MWILQEVVSVPITTFELEIDCRNACVGQPDAEADGLYLGRSGEGYLGDLDLRELAREFMSSIETAQLVRISLKGHRFREDTSIVWDYDSSEEQDNEDEINENGRQEGDSEVEGEDGENKVEGQLEEPESSQQEVERMIIVEGW